MMGLEVEPKGRIEKENFHEVELKIVV